MNHTAKGRGGRGKGQGSPRVSPRWAWGKQPVLAMLRLHPQKVLEVFLSPPEGDRERTEIAGLCQALKIPIHLRYPQQLDHLLSVPAHQGVIARLKEDPSFVSLDSLVGRLPMDQQPPPVLLALDRIQDPQNLGAIIRTALAAGVAGVLLPKDRSCPLTGAVRKAAAGAMELMPVVQVTNLGRSLDSLKEKGFWILSVEADAPDSLFGLDLRLPLVVVIGGEGQGVSRLVRQHSDWVASLPMQGVVSSLNASAACAVVLYEILRQNLSP